VTYLTEPVILVPLLLCSPSRTRATRLGGGVWPLPATPRCRLIMKVALVGMFQRVCLDEYDHQVEANDCLIDKLRMRNRELL
jgi:hypothetical protein